MKEGEVIRRRKGGQKLDVVVLCQDVFGLRKKPDRNREQGLVWQDYDRGPQLSEFTQTLKERMLERPNRTAQISEYSSISSNRIVDWYE